MLRINGTWNKNTKNTRKNSQFLLEKIKEQLIFRSLQLNSGKRACVWPY